MREKSHCCKADIYRGDEHILDGFYCVKCDHSCSFTTDEKKEKEIYDAIRNDMLRGTIQERLGYDLYDKILNSSFEGLPSASKEKFYAFLDKEPNILIISNG